MAYRRVTVSVRMPVAVKVREVAKVSGWQLADRIEAEKTRYGEN